MKTKLTISIDTELLQFARLYAKRQGKTISSLINDFLRKQQAQAEAEAATLTLDEVAGSLAGYDLPYTKAEIQAAYAKKYLKDDRS